MKLNPSLDPLESNNENNVQLKELKRIERDEIFVPFLVSVAAGVTSGLIMIYNKEIYVIAKNAADNIVSVGKKVNNRIVDVAKSQGSNIIKFGKKIGEITQPTIKKLCCWSNRQ